MAGFMDGEGSFEILGDEYKSSVRVKCSNSYKPVIQWLADITGCNLKEVGIVSKKPIFYWSCSGQNAVEISRLLIPFLKEKKRQAEILVEFRQLGTFGRYEPIPEAILLKRKELKEENRRLKHTHY